MPRNSTLVTREYYQLAVDSTNKNRMIAGSQDNGTDMHTDVSEPSWNGILPGDGADCAINPNEPSIAYATIFPPFSYFRTTKAGDANPVWKRITPSFPSGEQGNDLVMDLSKPSTLYIGSYRVWRTTIDGADWNPLPTTIADGSTWDTKGSVSGIAVAQSDNSIILIAHSTMGLLRSTDGGNSWVTRNPPDIMPALTPSWMNDVEVDPVNPNNAYLVYGEPFGLPQAPQIFMSSNGGKTWAPRITGLPPFRVFVLRVDPIEPGTIYCGTDVGPYRSTDQGGTWTRFGLGLPNVRVNDIRISRTAGS